MCRGILCLFLFLGRTDAAAEEWEMQASHSSASLRGVYSVDDVVAWASGSSGTVLRTLDGGSAWRRCSTPPGAENLDFRGIWAWDAKTAVVMSSGPGDLSRVYRTTDGCSHWAEERRNSDKEGFWDALVFHARDFGMLIGDPVGGRFYTEVIRGGKWEAASDSCAAEPGESAFAASNSSVFVFGPGRYILGIGGKGGARVLLSANLKRRDGEKGCLAVPVPVAGGNDSSGVFSLAFRDAKQGVAVGGDYKKPEDGSRTAAWTADGGLHWIAAAKPPHGYRSAVTWHAATKSWIAVGTNGSDISRDDGRTWEPLDNGNWNSLSLPYAVGPKGRIGKLRAEALKR